MESKVWKKSWVRGVAFEHGSQAHTHRARRITDPETEFNYVLKELKRQADNDRRARMSVEVACLGILDHPRIAKLIESNAGQFKEDVELYLVTECIHGTDLEKFVKRGRPTLPVSVDIILKVLDALKHCHEKDVLHRDIKPCHIILRDENSDDPVLIDFGLAFSEDLQPSDFETGTEIGVGNRFIVGPEQMGTGIDKRDRRTDIMQCVGVLYYVLTGIRPGIIRAPNGQKPHEKSPLEQTAPGLQEWQYEALRRIFGVGFEWDPENRWQSVEAVTGVITELTRTEQGERSFDERLRQLKERLANLPQIALWKKLEPAYQKLAQSGQEMAVKITNELNEHLVLTNDSSGTDRPRLRCSLQFTITNKVTGKQRRVNFGILVAGSEFVATGSIDNETKDGKESRVSVNDDAYIQRLESAMGDCLIEAAEAAAQ